MGVFKRVRKQKDESKIAYWYIRYTFNGKDVWESIGRVGEVTKAVAHRREEEQKRKIRMGVFEYQENITLEDIENDYIKYVEHTKKLRTYKKREGHLKTLKGYFEDKTLNKITPGDIDDFKLYRQENLKPASINVRGMLVTP